jgi:hypothetical protein
VPPVVQANVADACLRQQARPVVVVGLLVDRPAVGLGEDQAVVLPQRAGGDALLELRGLVPVQLRHQRHALRRRAGDCDLATEERAGPTSGRRGRDTPELS